MKGKGNAASYCLVAGLSFDDGTRMVEMDISDNTGLVERLLEVVVLPTYTRFQVIALLQRILSLNLDRMVLKGFIIG